MDDIKPEVGQVWEWPDGDRRTIEYVTEGAVMFSCHIKDHCFIAKMEDFMRDRHELKLVPPNSPPSWYEEWANNFAKEKYPTPFGTDYNEVRHINRKAFACALKEMWPLVNVIVELNKEFSKENHRSAQQISLSDILKEMDLIQ